MKKNPKFNLEKRRGLYFQMGVIVSLSFTLVAFTWTDYTKTFHSSLGFESTDAIEIDIIETSFREKPRPKPQPFVPSAIEVVDDKHLKMDDKPVKVVFSIDDLDTDYGDLDDDAEDDDLYGNGKSEDNTPLSPMRVEIAPYYEDCTNVLDRKQQMDCSYNKIKTFVSKNTTYPRLCLEGGIQGTVHMSFVVNKKGNIEDIKVERKVHRLLDKEAIRVFKTIPQLIPASQQGQAVKVRFNMPVVFKIAH